MRVIFYGNARVFGACVVDALCGGHEIAAGFVNRPDQQALVKKVVRSAGLQQRARGAWLACSFTLCRLLENGRGAGEFAAADADVAVVVAYASFLPQAVLDAPKSGCSEHPREPVAALARMLRRSSCDHGRDEETGVLHHGKWRLGWIQVRGCARCHTDPQY